MIKVRLTPFVAGDLSFTTEAAAEDGSAAAERLLPLLREVEVGGKPRTVELDAEVAARLLSDAECHADKARCWGFAEGGPTLRRSCLRIARDLRAQGVS